MLRTSLLDSSDARPPADLASATVSVDQYPTLTGAAHGVGAWPCPALGSQMEGSTFVKCTPFTSKKQRRALKAWETKRAKAAMEEAAAEDAVTRQAAAETQRQELQARGTCAPSGAPHSCTCSDFVCRRSQQRAIIDHEADGYHSDVPIRGNSLTYIDFSEADHMCLSYVKGVGKALPYTPEVS